MFGRHIFVVVKEFNKLELGLSPLKTQLHITCEYVKSFENVLKEHNFIHLYIPFWHCEQNDCIC